MPFPEPDWADGDPSKPVTAEKLAQLGKQYATVAADIQDPTTPVGAAVAQAIADALAAAGLGDPFVDNGNGTLTIKPGWFAENSPGILTLIDRAYVDNGDGTLTLGG